VYLIYTVTVYLFVRTIQQYIGVLHSIRYLKREREKFYSSENREVKKDIAILIPIYDEPKRLLKDAVEFWKEREETLYFITTAKEMECQSCRYLNELSGNFKTIHYPKNSGGKAEQLNYAIKSLNAQYYAIFDIDSRPEFEVLDYIYSDEVNREIYQAPTLFTGNFYKGSIFSKGNGIFQSRRVLAFEIPSWLNRDFSYLVGHGLIVRSDVAEKFPFVGQTVTEDLIFGYQTNLDGIYPKVVPFFDIAEVPKNSIRGTIQTGRWFVGDLTLFKFIQTDGNIRKLLFRYLHIFEWLLGSFVVIIALIFGTESTNITILSVLLLYIVLLHETANTIIKKRLSLSVYIGIIYKATINGIGPLYGLIRYILSQLGVLNYGFEKTKK